MKHLKNFNNFTTANEAIDYNDPNLIKFRALKNTLDNTPAKKSLSNSVRRTLVDKLDELEERLKDLYSERREVFMEMDMEAGEAGDNWSDSDANRYGDELNRIEEEIDRLKAKIEMIYSKLDESYLDFKQAASVAQDTHGAQRYDYGSNPLQGELDFSEPEDSFEEPDFTDRETVRKHMDDPKRKIDSIITMAEMMKGMIKKNPHPHVIVKLNDAYNCLRTAYLRTQDGY